MGAEPTEVNGPLKRADQGVASVGGFEAGELIEVTSQLRDPGRGRGFDERLSGRAKATERDLRRGLGANGPSGCGAGPAVVVVVNRGLTRRNNSMLGDHGSQQDNLDHAVGDADLDLFADVAGRDRVAR